MFIQVDMSSNRSLLGPPRIFFEGSVISIAVDNDNRRIYWINGARKIYRANVDGSGQTNIVNGSNFAGIALHPDNNMVFFTTDKTVEVVKVDGSGRRKLFTGSKTLTRLMGIAVEARQRLVFFASQQSIHKINFDGSNAVRIISNAMFIRGLAVDHQARRICFALKDVDAIKCSTYDGSNRIIVRNNIDTPWSLHIEDGVLFWTDDKPSRVSVSKLTTTAKRTVTFQTDLRSVTAVRCKCPMFQRYVVDPPVKKEVTSLLSDGNDETCLALGNTDHYTFDATSSRWSPQPQNKWLLPGLLIRRCVRDIIRRSLKVTIIGHHLTCSTSHFKVAIRQTKWKSVYDLAGEYRTCKWSDAVQSGQLTTCVAACRCDGDDCSHVIIHIPKKFQEWKICEINIK